MERFHIRHFGQSPWPLLRRSLTLVASWTWPWRRSSTRCLKRRVRLDRYLPYGLPQGMGLPFNRSTSQLVKKFMEVHRDKDNFKIFFDEFPVSKHDRIATKEDKDSELIKMLQEIANKTCLLETVFAPGSKTKAIRERFERFISL